ncbi:MAG: exostosin family protein [Candidatus Pacebacteria bacterium]|nr:exostosin family protein [Candidatus Paceibacterota bacterium]
MIKVWTDVPLPLSYMPLLYPNWGVQTKDAHLFFSKKAFAHFSKPFVEIAEDPASADFLLIPHNFPLVRERKEYLDNFARLSKKHNKKIIIFVYGDSMEKVCVENAVVFRTSRYKSEKEKNEIMMPPFVEDLTGEFEFQPRMKTDSKPIIGFCGWTSSGGVWRKTKQFAKKILRLAGWRNIDAADGIALRNKIIKILKRSRLVETNFIERKTYSGHASTISLPPEIARREYAENMSGSDLALVVRGNGNFSFRFYETLSAGRVPLFVDTDCALPLEQIVNYKDFCLFIDRRNIKKIGESAAGFYRNLNGEKFVLMQKEARKAFEDYLRSDKFFELMFLKEEIKKFL